MAFDLILFDQVQVIIQLTHNWDSHWYMHARYVLIRDSLKMLQQSLQNQIQSVNMYNLA